MKSYSSTVLKLLDNHCPAALGFHERHEPAFNDHFQAGIAAHAVLQVVGEKQAATSEQQRAVADAVTQELITKGRSFKGRHEPPMQPSAAFEGRDIALAWLERNELPSHGRHEILLGMDGAGMPIPAETQGARYEAIIDLVYRQELGDEDWSIQAAVVRDYKSAWPTNADELDTLQRKGQAVLTWLYHPDVGAIVQEVCNLRTGATYRREIILDDEGLAQLGRWRDDILAVCRAADVTREARPGVGCIDCPYILRCEDGQKLMHASDLPADKYASALAMQQEYAKILRKLTKHEPATDSAGGKVGYQATLSREVDHVALADQLSVLWTGSAAGLAQALQPGVQAVEKLAKTLFPGRDGFASRDDFLSAVMNDKPGCKFTTWK